MATDESQPWDDEPIDIDTDADDPEDEFVVSHSDANDGHESGSGAERAFLVSVIVALVGAAILAFAGDVGRAFMLIMMGFGISFAWVFYAEVSA